jgi:hypothetical protein
MLNGSAPASRPTPFHGAKPDAKGVLTRCRVGGVLSARDTRPFTRSSARERNRERTGFASQAQRVTEADCGEQQPTE